MSDGDNAMTMFIEETINLKKIFQKEGYKVLSALNGKKGRELAYEYKPDIILLDVMMPGETGYHVIEWLKRTAQTASIPIIFLTGKDDLGSKIKGFKLGAVDYIVKPFFPQEVILRAGLHIKLNTATNALISSQAEKLKQLKKAHMVVTYKPNYVNIYLILNLKNKEKDITIPLTLNLGHSSIKTEKTNFAII